MSIQDNINTQTMNLDEAIDLLKKIVKDSHLNNQKHIDLSLCVASERHIYELALMKTQSAIAKNELTQDELKRRLGLIA